MNTSTKSEQAALTVLDRASIALGASEYEIKLQKLLTNSVRIVAPTNKAARDECHAAYMVLKNARCSIVNLAADATEDAKAFTKAVKAESERLIAITTAEEDRLQGLRDAWDAAVEAEKAAKIAAERARVEAIQSRINDIRMIPMAANGQSAAYISKLISIHAGDIPGADLGEFEEEAKRLHAEALDQLSKMEAKQRDIEIEAESQRQEAARKAAEAEEARKAEAERLAAERAELAKLRAEADERDRLAKVMAERIANEQAAERKRLADIAAAQEAAAVDLRRKAAENLQADRDAQAELLRRERAQQAIAQDAQRLADDHGPALEMNVQFDAERAAQDPADLERCTATAKAMLSNGRMTDLADELNPTFAEIEALGEDFGLTLAQWVARLELFVVEAREELARLEVTP